MKGFGISMRALALGSVTHSVTAQSADLLAQVCPTNSYTDTTTSVQKVGTGACKDDGLCPTLFEVFDLESRVVPSASFSSDGKLTLTMDISSSATNDALLDKVRVNVDCFDFEFTTDFCNTSPDTLELGSDISGCEESTTVAMTLDPADMKEECTEGVTMYPNGTMGLALRMEIELGYEDSDSTFVDIAYFTHCISYNIDVEDRVAIFTGLTGVVTENVYESLNLGVEAMLVQTASDASDPCNDIPLPDDTKVVANERVCIAVKPTLKDKDDYAAFVKHAVVTNTVTEVESQLVDTRIAVAGGTPTKDAKYPGSFWMDATKETVTSDDVAFVDMFTFFLDPQLFPAEGTEDTLNISVVVEFHELEAGSRRLLEGGKRHVAVHNLALEDYGRALQSEGDDVSNAAAVNMGVTMPPLAPSGGASVRIVADVGLDGELTQDYADAIVASTTDTANVRSDQVNLVASTANDASSSRVEIEIFGIDDASASSIANAIELDFSGGNFFFRLNSYDLPANSVSLVSSTYQNAPLDAEVLSLPVHLDTAIVLACPSDELSTPASHVQIKELISGAVRDVKFDMVSDVRVEQHDAGSKVGFSIMLEDNRAAYVAKIQEALMVAAGVGGTMEGISSELFSDCALDSLASQTEMKVETRILALGSNADCDDDKSNGISKTRAYMYAIVTAAVLITLFVLYLAFVANRDKTLNLAIRADAVAHKTSEPAP